MPYLLRWAVVFAAVIGGTIYAQAEEWRTHSGTNPRGLESASMSTQLHEFGLQFNCDEHDWQDYRLAVMFSGPPLPRLDGDDGDTAKLTLLFTRKSGEQFREVWEAYYFDGGPGDQAWLGSINAGKPVLDALASAVKLDIVNKNSDLIYSFETIGTAVGVAKFREVCKLGLE